jgi:hypothetical protein
MSGGRDAINWMLQCAVAVDVGLGPGDRMNGVGGWISRNRRVDPIGIGLGAWDSRHSELVRFRQTCIQV